ncbi:hypothetical protein [Streptomyces longispororuber]|nr:hypothetical protein [Streptomyces longispororuber]
MAAGLLPLLSTAVDLAVIGHHDAIARAAVTVVDVAANLLGASPLGLRIPPNLAAGAGDEEQTRRLTTTGTAVALATGCAVAVLLPGALCGHAVAGPPGAFAAFVAYWAAGLLLTAVAVRRHEGAAVPVGAGT